MNSHRVAAAALGMGLWRRVPIPAAAFGAAALAVVINLLAAGGIGFSAVALSLWLAAGCSSGISVRQTSEPSLEAAWRQSMARRESLTIRQIALRVAGARGKSVVRGSPQSSR